MNQQLDGFKKCPTCTKDLPPHGFHKNKSQEDGLQVQCKVCQAVLARKKREEKAKTRQPYRTNKTEVIDGVVGKSCFTCKTFKPTSEFFKESKNYSGLSGSCKSCESEGCRVSAKKHYEAHREQALKRQADYVKTNYERVATKRTNKRRQQVETLHPLYVEKLLKLPKKHITPELIDLKTQAIQIKRISKHISTTLKKGNS